MLVHGPSSGRRLLYIPGATPPLFECPVRPRSCSLHWWSWPRCEVLGPPRSCVSIVPDQGRRWLAKAHQRSGLNDLHNLFITASSRRPSGCSCPSPSMHGLALCEQPAPHVSRMARLTRSNKSFRLFFSFSMYFQKKFKIEKRDLLICGSKLKVLYMKIYQKMCRLYLSYAHKAIPSIRLVFNVFHP
jgi:hypothetical protein